MANDLIVRVVLRLQDELTSLLDTSQKKLEGFGERAKEISRDLSDFGRTVGAAGAAITAGFGFAVKEFADLESATATLKASLTGSGGLSPQFEALRDLSIELGKTLPGNTKDFTEMIDVLLRRGVSVDSVLNGVGESAAKLATVIKVPFSEAAEIAASLKEATGTADAEMLGLLDTIQRLAFQGVQARDATYAFARSAGALKEFGLQGKEAADQVGALFAKLIKSGSTGETVGTGFAAILNRILQFEAGATKPMQNAASELDNLGIKLRFFDEQSQQFLGIDNMVRELEKLKALPQVTRGGILQSIFGGGQDQQFVQQIIAGGEAGLRQMQDLMAKQGDLQSRANVQATTLANQWETAMGSFSTTLAKVGGLLENVLKPFVVTLGEVSDSIGKWIDNNKETAEVIAKVFGGIGIALTAIGGLALGASGVAAVFGAVATGLSTIGTVAATVGPALAALALNPVVLAILGVGAAAGLVYAYWDEITGALTTAKDAVVGVVTSLVDHIQRGLSFLDDLGISFKRAGEGLVSSLARAMLEGGAKIGQGLRAAISDAAKSLAATAKDWLKIGENIVQGLIDGIKAKAAEVLKNIGDLGRSILSTVSKVLDIRSPSQRMYELGRMTAAGFALGIAAGIPQVGTAAADLAQVAPTAAEQEITDKPKSSAIDMGEIDTEYRERILRETQEHMRSLERLYSDGWSAIGEAHTNHEQTKRNTTKIYRAWEISDTQNFLGSVAALMTTRSRKMFEVGKAAAIANTIIETYLGAQRVFTALAGTGPYGWALGAVAAAAAIAAGMARVNAIRSQTFNGGGSIAGLGGGGGLGGLSSSSSLAVAPPPASVEKVDVAPAREVNIYVKGEEIYSAQSIRDSLIPALNEALGDGVTLNVRAA